MYSKMKSIFELMTH